MVLLAITAMFKSAQIPFHGWLVEVMEAPTPVSALLHAGLINAGPFLMLRFAHVLDATFYAPLVLFIIGGLSAIYGAMVFSTQSAVKTALGYSSVAHMGFTIMTCGLGVYPAALLHLTAHSFYKAHAFLSSGSLVDASRLYNLRASYRQGNPLKIFSGIAVATALFGTLVYFVNQQTTIPFQLEFIGYIIFLAVVTLLANAFDSRSATRSIFMVVGFAGLVILAFLSFEFMMEAAIHKQLPGLKEVSTPMLYSGYALMVIFSVAILFTVVTPLINKTEAYRSFGVHLRNGLYLNMYFDRLVGAHNVPKAKNRLK
jgi:NAD(P)H-quinone oxidoreductase subunit 5